MSSKMIVGIVAAVVVIAGGAWYFVGNLDSNSMTPTQMAAMEQDKAVAAKAQALASAAATATTTDTTANPTTTAPKSGNSDSDLNQDAASIDTQMSGLNSDNTSADAGMNSQ